MRPPTQPFRTVFSPPRVPLAPTATLDRTAFTKTISLAAASTRDPRFISKWRGALSKCKELLDQPRTPRVAPVPPAELPNVMCQMKETHIQEQSLLSESERTLWKEPSPKSLRCLVLHQSVSASDESTYGPGLKQGLLSGELVCVFPFKLTLDYDYWTWNEMVTAILPEELYSEIPHGFNSAGHIAHLNLRAQHLPYGKLIGQILLDKCQPNIRTVINKTDEVGETSEFRTFSYELLAGEDDMDVVQNKMDCVFRFNYAQTYWNTKLDQEHRRIVDMFRPGEAVVDVMSGIGPFAVPAGKKGVFVWGNDYNPASVGFMRDAIQLNKVSPLVFPHNQNGHSFIPFSATAVLEAHHTKKAVALHPQKPWGNKPRKPDKVIPIPATISHFVMNLPGSAPEFLPDFRGLYRGHEDLFLTTPADDNAGGTGRSELPLLHVYCFAAKSYYAESVLEDSELPYREIQERFSRQLSVDMRVARRDGKTDGLKEGQMSVWDVRDVSPKKSMYCVSFRLPREVAFAEAAGLP